jgi:hypothetical protein
VADGDDVAAADAFICEICREFSATAVTKTP